jgi:hypothetical protein
MEGTWVDGAEATAAIRASVQPLRGRELLSLPEGERTREWVKIYCASELRTLDEAAGTRADTIIYQGKAYQVRQVEPWEATGMVIGPYWKALACRVEPAEEAP